MSCNVDKTVCMVFQPTYRNKAIAAEFPPFTIGDRTLQYVEEFCYLGHVIKNKFNDDDDIKREVRNLFMRTNILIEGMENARSVLNLPFLKLTACVCMMLVCGVVTLLVYLIS